METGNDSKQKNKPDSAIHNIGRTLKRILAFKGAQLGEVIVSKGILTQENAAACLKIIRRSSEQSKYSFRDLVTNVSDPHFILYMVAALIILTKRSYCLHLVTNRSLRQPGVMDIFNSKVQDTLDKLCTTETWITARKHCERKFVEGEVPDIPEFKRDQPPGTVLGLLSLREGQYYIDCVVAMPEFTTRATKTALKDLLEKYSKYSCVLKAVGVFCDQTRAASAPVPAVVNPMIKSAATPTGNPASTASENSAASLTGNVTANVAPMFGGNSLGNPMMLMGATSTSFMGNQITGCPPGSLAGQARTAFGVLGNNVINNATGNNVPNTLGSVRNEGISNSAGHSMVSLERTFAANPVLK